MTDSLTPSRMTDEQIKPCPMCGGVAHLTKGYAFDVAAWPHGDFHRVFCGACQLRQLFYRTPEEAIAAWNRRLAAAGERAPLQGAEAGRAVAQRMLANPGMRSILQNLKDGAAGERVDAPAEPNIPKIEADAIFYAAMSCLPAVTQAYRYFHVQGKTEEDFDACAGDAMTKAVRNAVQLTAREVRDPVWPYALAASPADAPQPAKAAEPPKTDSRCNYLAIGWCNKCGNEHDVGGSPWPRIAPAKAACPAPVEPIDLRKALERIAERGPIPTQSQSGRPRLRCWHCRNAWMVGHEPERHSDNCAWIIAREALAASPSSAASASPATQPPATLPESMSRDEMLKYYSDYANMVAAAVTIYQKQIRELKAAQELDAARYRWLRQQQWNTASLFVIAGSKSLVRLGTDCPSLDRLDAAIDAAMEPDGEPAAHHPEERNA